MKIEKLVIGIVAVLLFFIFLNPFGTIPAGERGVRLQFGAVTGDVISEGLYLKWPFIQSVKRMNVQIQKETVTASAASKDLQEVSAKISLNYHLDPKEVAIIYKNIGMDYSAKIIAPAIQESVKASTAQFTAEELVTRRSEVRETIKALVIEKVAKIGVMVDAFNLEDVNFSISFNKAIEAKVTAEQSALEAQNKLEQVKFEAEQKIAKATADAEAIRIQAQAITQQGGKDYVNLQWIEAWKAGGSQVPDFITSDNGGSFLFNLE